MENQKLLSRHKKVPAFIHNGDSFATFLIQSQLHKTILQDKWCSTPMA